MNVEEALKVLKDGEILKSNQWIGIFSWTGDSVYFDCGGEYPCCHEWISEEEFLEYHKDEIFTLA